jgi:hypothetical protein
MGFWESLFGGMTAINGMVEEGQSDQDDLHSIREINGELKAILHAFQNDRAMRRFAEDIQWAQSISQFDGIDESFWDSHQFVQQGNEEYTKWIGDIMNRYGLHSKKRFSMTIGDQE